MTVQEWQGLDKTPGRVLYPTDGKGAGRLVSHIERGATLDFTEKEEYRKVSRAYYPFQMLATEMMKPKEPDKRHAPRDTLHVQCVETGDVFLSMNRVAEMFRTSHGYVKEAVQNHKKLRGFTFIEAPPGAKLTPTAEYKSYKCPVKCIETGTVYESGEKAAEACGAKLSSFWRCVAKGLAIGGKWHFVKIDVSSN